MEENCGYEAAMRDRDAGHTLEMIGTTSSRIKNCSTMENMRMLRFLGVLSALLVLLLTTAARGQSISGQGSSDARGLPVTVSGWRYAKEPNDLHAFYCDRPECAPRSKVSYRLYPPNMEVTLEQFRADQELVVRALRERVLPGTKIDIVGFEGSNVRKKNDPLRVFKVRRIQTGPDGMQIHFISSIIVGPRFSSSLISSSADKKANEATYATFAAGLMAAAAIDLNAKR